MILALDTGSDFASVALGDSEKLVAFETLQTKRSAEGLLQAIDGFRTRLGDLDTVSAIATSIGPGGFTGIRIGLALAQGFAMAKGVEIIGVSSLLAQLVSSDPQEGVHRIALSLREGEELSTKFSVQKVGTLHFSVQELSPITVNSSPSPHAGTIDARMVLAAAARVVLFEGGQQFVRTGPDRPIMALYGKPVQAKTLVERGVQERA